MEEEYTKQAIDELIQELQDLETIITNGEIYQMDGISTIEEITKLHSKVTAIARKSYLVFEQQGFEYVVQPAMKQAGLLKS